MFILLKFFFFTIVHLRFLDFFSHLVIITLNIQIRTSYYERGLCWPQILVGLDSLQRQPLSFGNRCFKLKFYLQVREKL